MALAFRSFAFLSLIISAAFAQSPSDSLIPTGISSSCANFLTSLDNNTALTACTSPFTSSLNQFAPGSPSSASTSTINSVLNSLCSTSAFSACPSSTLTTQLASFYAACSSELTSSPNQLVKNTYDMVFSLVPIRETICAKDDAGNYCAAQLSNNNNTGNVAIVDSAKSQQDGLLNSYLYTPLHGSTSARRDVNSSTTYVPNATTIQSTNLLFLFLQPSMSSAQLCTTCTRKILAPYINFESSILYAPGLPNSPFFAGQSPLYNNITSKCGPSFLSGAVQAAGGLSGGIMSGAVPRVASQELSAAFSAIVGAAAFVAASL